MFGWMGGALQVAASLFTRERIVMQVGNHAPVRQNGDMLFCSTCHRSWSKDEEGDMAATACNPEYQNDNPRPPKPRKAQGWMGPGHRGRR